MFELARRTSRPMVSYYNPFREMEELERRFFGRPFDSFFGESPVTEFKTDVTDEGDHFLLEADLPGFKKENIHLELNGDVLTVNASRNSQTEEKNKENKVIRSERSYGSYSRSYDLTGIDNENIKAKYEDGVLTLTLPKKNPTLPEKRRLELE